MTITEESRYQLYKTLEDTLGAEDANTLMEHLPPVGWADVATKADVGLLKADIDLLKGDLVQMEQRLERRMEQRFEQSEDRFDKKLSDALYRQFVQSLGATAVMLSLAVAVNQLLGG